jgi:DNA-binding GntR family transcriptional regulator
MSTFDFDRPPAATPRSRIAVVCEVIRSEILEGQIAPGSRLHLGKLAERHDASPSAIREALSRLVSDGWVKAIDQRGFRVCEVSADDLIDITRTRIDLESLALRRSIDQGDVAWEARVLAAYHELSRATPLQVGALKDSMLSWQVLHRRFHSALVSASGSDWMMRFREVLTDQSERYRKLSVDRPAGPRDVDQEHREIAHAALDRDADACVKLLSAHFNHTAEIVLASIAWDGRLAEGPASS